MRPFSDSISLSRGSRTSRKSGCNLAPIHLWVIFQPLLASEQALDIPKESIAKVTAPVLTIHGRKDRNAPYGGRARVGHVAAERCPITIDTAAHMSWVEFSEIVFPSVDLFINGQWLKQAETGKSLELPPSKTGVQSDEERN